MDDAPKVSVLTPTYNHQAFIRQAVISALSQETTFPIEVVVGEDCSTDETRTILLELQRLYPSKLRLLLHEQNLGAQRNFAKVFAACRGDYVAMLEGDDYWTDPQKLQKQVDALDAHPEWALCFHPARMVYEDSDRGDEVYPENWTKEVATIDDLFVADFMATCSVVFRNRLFGPIPAWHREIAPGDWALHLLNANCGHIGFLHEVMADYRIHSGGMWTRTDELTRLTEILRMFSRVDHHFKGKYARQIDEFRINLVTWLALQNKNLKWELDRLLRPKAPERSSIYKLGRSIMRPVERLGRRCGAALGISNAVN